MHWKKLGIVYKPDGAFPWASSHAMIPTPLRLNNDIIRVYVTFCDKDGIGRPGFVDVLATDPKTVINVSTKPLLELGEPGSFDDHGILTCSVVNMGSNRVFMYYVGFELSTTIRYRLLTGLAISEDGGSSFTRNSSTPILERSDTERLFRGGPYCIPGKPNKLWYVAGSKWTDINNKSMPVYNIRYLESPDGINWPSKGEVIIDITKDDEHGFGRPAVIKKKTGGYRMFYSIRRRSLNAYRLGYAESDDGISWTRMDEKLNLDTTLGEFDSDAIMYAAPIEINNRLYVFYNGNDFGREGFALARLEDE
ncbi:glycoside hydrolase family protein [Aeromonas schubertii]|uniref:hypothetical protein n=1 Tax=Aeromonas schubertii TaxID=652 RepID=UPI0010A7E7CB|nr:hypothetical protein [Aeromonas schubertii]QCG48638.1 hypothetical protein E2P79_13025 [Aeromonas schubertii]